MVFDGASGVDAVADATRRVVAWWANDGAFALGKLVPEGTDAPQLDAGSLLPVVLPDNDCNTRLLQTLDFTGFSGQMVFSPSPSLPTAEDFVGWNLQGETMDLSFLVQTQRGRILCSSSDGTLSYGCDINFPVLHSDRYVLRWCVAAGTIAFSCQCVSTGKAIACSFYLYDHTASTETCTFVCNGRAVRIGRIDVDRAYNAACDWRTLMLPGEPSGDGVTHVFRADVPSTIVVQDTNLQQWNSTEGGLWVMTSKVATASAPLKPISGPPRAAVFFNERSYELVSPEAIPVRRSAVYLCFRLVDRDESSQSPWLALAFTLSVGYLSVHVNTGQGTFNMSLNGNIISGPTAFPKDNGKLYTISYVIESGAIEVRLNDRAADGQTRDPVRFRVPMEENALSTTGQLRVQGYNVHLHELGIRTAVPDAAAWTATVAAATARW